LISPLANVNCIRLPAYVTSLHVAERPKWRHRGGSGDHREILHGFCRIVRVEDEDVVHAWNDRVWRRQSFRQGLLLITFRLRQAVGIGGFPRKEYAAVGVSKIDLPPRRGDKHATEGRSGKSLAKLTGFRVTRMLRSPAARTSSCAGWPAAVTSCPYAAGGACHQCDKERGIVEQRACEWSLTLFRNWALTIA
jgi:hypothetical protein